MAPARKDRGKKKRAFARGHDVQKTASLQTELRATKHNLAVAQQQKTVEDDKTNHSCRAMVSEALPFHHDDGIRFLFVGPDHAPVTVHWALLPSVTQTFFKTIEVKWHGPAMEFPCYPLPGEDLETVRLWRLYLYSGKLYSKSEDNFDIEDDGEAMEHGDREWHKLVLMYLFGIVVNEEKFCNVVIGALVEKIEESDRYMTDLATEVYANTMEGDKLRKLYVDQHIWVGLGQGIDSKRLPHPYDDADGPAEFQIDVLHGLIDAGDSVHYEHEQKPWQKPGALCACYHQHQYTTRCGEDDVEVVDLTME